MNIQEASMCDYSLHSVSSRPAKAGNELVTTSFPGTSTRGFAAVNQPAVAVCLLPGTELAFESDVDWRRPLFRLFQKKPAGGRVARFRQVNKEHAAKHHDAVEFANGEIVLLTDLRPGQRATVLQLPIADRPPPRHPAIIDAEPVRTRELDHT
jgi:hypothetical protein